MNAAARQDTGSVTRTWPGGPGNLEANARIDELEGRLGRAQQEHDDLVAAAELLARQWAELAAALRDKSRAITAAADRRTARTGLPSPKQMLAADRLKARADTWSEAVRDLRDAITQTRDA